MLSEIRNPRQVPGEGFRRWFTDEYFDLIVWYDEARRLIGFQHNRIDDGEIPGRSKMTPIVVADGSFNARPVAERFREASAAIEPGIAAFVSETLNRYPSSGKPAGSS